MPLRCEQCGEPRDPAADECPICGHEGPPTAGDSPPDVTGRDVVWVCQQCGRRMPKRSPPCGRCGGMAIEAEAIDWEAELAEETTAGGYLDVGWNYVVIGVGLLVLLGIVASGLGALPQDDGTPTVDDAPGEGEIAAGHNLTAVERAVHDRVNEERRAAGSEALASDDDLRALAEYHNRDLVAQRYAEGILAEIAVEDRYDEFEYDCPRSPHGVLVILGYGDGATDRPIDRYETDADLGAAIAAAVLSNEETSDSLLADRDAAGVDVHVAPDGAVYATYTAC